MIPPFTPFHGLGRSGHGTGAGKVAGATPMVEAAPAGRSLIHVGSQARCTRQSSPYRADAGWAGPAAAADFGMWAHGMR